MGKSKKSKKPRPRSATTNPQPYGFDYGCLPYAMAVSTVELVNHLTRASTDAVAYGSVWSDAVKATFKDETKRDRRVGLQEEQALLAACSQMNGGEHKYAGPLLHDRLIGALETCCRKGEMLRIRNRHVDWEHHQIAIPGRHAKDSENRRVPFDPQGRLAPILKRRASLGPSAFVFGSPGGEYVEDFKTAWESLLLLANGHDITRAKPGARVDRVKLRQIDLHWHDLRHEGACRLLGDGVDIRTIHLMLGHADIKQTQRYLNITDEELRRSMTGLLERRRQLKAVSQ